MTDNQMDRRQFLRTSGGAAAGAAVASAGGSMFSTKAWAQTLETLNSHEGATLLAMTRTMFPHRSLADQYYAVVVNDLDAEAKSSPDTAKLLKDGVAALDGASAVKFVDLSDGYRLKVLETMQDSALFGKVKGKAVVSLYNQKLVWRHFGYEGSSAEFSGYLARGFDDLNWLDSPPASASPKAG